MSKRVRVRDFFYDGQDRVVLQGGDIGPDGQVQRGTEQPKRNGLQYLYGGTPHSPGDEFEMSDDHAKQETIGSPESTLELASVHAARLQRQAQREQAAQSKASEGGNWFAAQSKADEDRIRAHALSQKFQSERAREHIDRALGGSGRAAGDSLLAALEEEKEHAASQRTKLEEQLQAVVKERAELQASRDRLGLEEQLRVAAQERAELQASKEAQQKASDEAIAELRNRAEKERLAHEEALRDLADLRAQVAGKSPAAEGPAVVVPTAAPVAAPKPAESPTAPDPVPAAKPAATPVAQVAAPSQQGKKKN